MIIHHEQQWWKVTKAEDDLGENNASHTLKPEQIREAKDNKSTKMCTTEMELRSANDGLSINHDSSFLLLLTGLILSVLIGIGWIGSCGREPTLQVAEKQPQRAEGQPGETPVSFQPTKQKKGSRCGPRYYAQVGSDDDNNPVCYELQKRLVDAAKDGKLDAMRAALRDGANPEGSIYNYHPPLHTAAAGGQVEAVRLLLDNGAQVNRVSNFKTLH